MVACHVLDPFNYDVQFANLAEKIHSSTDQQLGRPPCKDCRTKAQRLRTGKISRRKLIETLTLAATTV